MINNLKQEEGGTHFISQFIYCVFVVIFGYGVFNQIESKQQLNDSALLKLEILFAIICLAFISFMLIYLKKNINLHFLQRHPPYIV